MRRFAWLFLFVLGCRPAGDYFPLTTGQTWTNRQEMTRVLDGDTTMESNDIVSVVKPLVYYYKLGPVIPVNQIRGRDTVPHYYRRRGNEVWDCFITPKGEPDSVQFLSSSIAIGDSWPFSPYVNCKVTGREDITVPAGWFRNCLVVAFSFLGNRDASETRWYAPGVGVVRDEYALRQTRGGHELIQHSVTELTRFGP